MTAARKNAKRTGRGTAWNSPAFDDQAFFYRLNDFGVAEPDPGHGSGTPETEQLAVANGERVDVFGGATKRFAKVSTIFLTFGGPNFFETMVFVHDGVEIDLNKDLEQLRSETLAGAFANHRALVERYLGPGAGPGWIGRGVEFAKLLDEAAGLLSRDAVKPGCEREAERQLARLGAALEELAR